MTQWEFDTIVMLIKNGAPTLADQLYESFKKLVEEYLVLKAEKDAQVKTETEETEI